jgi:NAD(P)-dependent dehydrogenase (short-subunit alcohol dehydrogenase family)
MSEAAAGRPPAWAAGLEGHVALVTGAGRGLGRACALALSHAGAEVIAVARTASELESLAAEVPGVVRCWVEDVTGDALLGRIEALDRLDVLVNNAGGNRPMPFAEVPDDVLDWLLDLNVRAAFRVARSAARVMLTRGAGSIVHMSSQMGHVGSPGRTVYCMTKHALEGLSRAMAVELAPHGIRVNTVAPTFTETPLGRQMMSDPEFERFVLGMIPMGHIAQPDDVAAAVLYLASPASRMVTGTSLRVDGGWTAA